MTYQPNHAVARRRGFTLVELLAVFAIMAILAGLVLPAVAPARNSPAIYCMNNLKQMQLGWVMYADDFKGILLPNAPGDLKLDSQRPLSGNSIAWSGLEQEGWGALDANTNSAYYAQSLLNPYLAHQTDTYRCPADSVPSANGQRLRSYSMNGQVGQHLLSQLGPGYLANNNPGYRVYNTMDDLTCPGPSMSWIFCDEHAGSIDDGFLRVNLSNPIWPDVPGSYHGGSCGFSFADGHVEMRKWLTAAIKIPVILGVTLHDVEAGRNNPDYLWFAQRTACLAGE